MTMNLGNLIHSRFRNIYIIYLRGHITDVAGFPPSTGPARPEEIKKILGGYQL